MTPTFYYFLQVILCSGIMVGYYWLVLRNNRFHQYNRFYLLAIVLFSWVVPLIKIQWNKPVATDAQLIQFFSVIADSNTEIESKLHSGWLQYGWQGILMMIYVLVGIVLLVGLIKSLIQIYSLLKTHSCKTVGDVFLIITKAKGAPFSFFRYIFWHESIDLRSDAGKQMMQHELTHVQQKHSVDKIFMQLVLIAGWFNPFFWLINKEMEMIHEFIADKKAVANGDTSSLAQMLLAAAFPQQQYLLTNPFFFSPIKRRLQMITKNTNPKYSYMRRLIVLPLLAIVIVLFAFRTEASRSEKPITVATVIENIAAPIKEQFSIKSADTTILNSDSIYVIPSGKNVQIIKNETGKSITVVGKGNQFSFSGDNEGKGSMLLRSFPNGAKPIIELNGKRIDEQELNSISSNEILSVNVYKGKMAEELYGADAKNGIIKVITKKGNLKSLNVQEIVVDSVIIKTNKDQEMDQSIVIVDGKKMDIKLSELKISPDEIATINIIKSDRIPLNKTGGKENIIEITTKGEGGKILVVEKNSKSSAAIKALKEKNQDIQSIYWVHSPLRMKVQFKDGSEELYDLTNPASLGRAEKKYGKLPVPPPPPPGHTEQVKEESYDKVFTKVEQPASFPGGKYAWQKYLDRNLNKDLPVSKGAPPGKYKVIVSFNVSSDGTISDVKAENDPGYGTDVESVRIIVKGPKWIPAKQNGNAVTSIVKQTITFSVKEK